MKYFKLIWAGLWRSKSRTILTMLSIVIAFQLFGVLYGVSAGMKNVYKSVSVDRLYVMSNVGLLDGLPISYLNRLKSVDGIRAVTYWTHFAGFYQNANQPLSVIATDVPAHFQVYDKLQIPSEQLETMKITRPGAVINKRVAAQYGWKIGDQVPVGTPLWARKGAGNSWTFEVVGIFDATAYGDSANFPSFYINYDYFDEARTFSDGLVHHYVVGVTSPSRGAAIAKTIDAMFQNSSYETSTQTEQALLSNQLKQVLDVDLLVKSVVIAVFFSLLFLTGNTMMQSVRARIPDFAVLRALGYSDMQVLALVMIESVILCVGASLIGLGLARLIFPAVGALFGNLTMPLTVILSGILIAVGLAVVTGLPPALRVKRMNVVDALAGR